jgi:hypothetical protein
MTFRFANVEGRAALVDSEGRWFDASRVSRGVISADPMKAWLQLDELHRAAGTTPEAVHDGTLGEAVVRPAIPRLGAYSLSDSTIGRMRTRPT